MQIHRSVALFVIVAGLLASTTLGEHLRYEERGVHWEPPHVKDYGTEIHIKACNSQPHPPGPRQKAVCHRGGADTTAGNATQPECRVLKVIPGQCKLGYSISCFYFERCIMSEFYPMSSQCTGINVNQVVGPCDNTFSPVIPGCAFYKCNETGFQEHKCTPRAAGEGNVADSNQNTLVRKTVTADQQEMATATALRSIVEAHQAIGGTDGLEPTMANSESVTQVSGHQLPVHKRDRFFRGLERNCTHSTQCIEKQGMDFGRCTDLGGSSVFNRKMTGSMKAGRPFEHCGWVVISKWDDEHCRGPPDHEFASHTGDCKFRPNPFKPGEYAAMNINCIKK